MMASLRFEVEELVVERGGRRILDGVSFSAGPGDYVEITGPNGAGKTSLLRSLAGLLRPADGRVFAASNLGPLDDDEKMRSLHFVGHRDGLKGPLTVEDHAKFWRRLYGGEDEMKVIEAIGLGPLKHRPARTLSAGQARRLSLSRLLIAPRPIWLLDEPASTLDVQARVWLLGLVGDHLAAGGILIAAVHDPIGYGPTREIAIDGLGAEPEFETEPEQVEPEAEPEPAP